MNLIGQKIREIRKKKGLSQEELADAASVNLRTIQRIEKGESGPRGKTLHLICEVLAIGIEDILDYGKEEDNSYLIFLHLSVLSFLVIPLGNIILPLILWLTKKDKVIGLSSSGANLLNFQITWALITFTSFTGFILGRIMHLNGFFWSSYLTGALYLINILLPILFAFQLKSGKRKPFYPTLIRWIT